MEKTLIAYTRLEAMPYNGIAVLCYCHEMLYRMYHFVSCSLKYFIDALRAFKDEKIDITIPVLNANVDDMEMEEVDVFFEEFFAAYLKTLDELQ